MDPWSCDPWQSVNPTLPTQCMEHPALTRAAARQRWAKPARVRRKVCCSGSQPNCTGNCDNLPSMKTLASRQSGWKRWNGPSKNTNDRRLVGPLINVVDMDKSNMKLGSTGVYVGIQYLKRYLAEFDFRYNKRNDYCRELTLVAGLKGGSAVTKHPS